MKKGLRLGALLLSVCLMVCLIQPAEAYTYQFADRDQITSLESAELMVALRIMAPYSDMTFKPQGEVRRAELAKYMALLSNAGEDVSPLYASACDFVDISKDAWYAAYVAYCGKTGMLCHLGQFYDPAGCAAGMDCLEMLLVILGFDGREQGYYGSEWKNNVRKDAERVGLLRGMEPEFDPEAFVTRGQLAQLMRNALLINVAIGTINLNDRFWEKPVDQDQFLKMQDWKLFPSKNGVVVISDKQLYHIFNGLSRVEQRDEQGQTVVYWRLTQNGGTWEYGPYPVV